MNNDENYTPTLDDEATYATLLTGGVLGKIHQLYNAGKFDLETHKELYEAAHQADTQVRKLAELIELKK